MPASASRMEGEVRFHHLTPELWVLDARGCAHRWVVFHETYSFCLADAALSEAVDWRYNHRVYTVDDGHRIMAMQPGELHANVHRTPPSDFIVVQVGEALMKRIASELGWPFPQLNLNYPSPGLSHPQLVEALRVFRTGLCSTLFGALPDGGLCTCGRSLDRLLEDLTEIVRVFLEHYVEDARQLTVASKGPAALRRAKEYLHAHFDAPYDLARLAEAAGCGKYYLSHLFKQEFGVSPSEYQNRLLIARACSLIARFPQHSLDRIVQTVGWPGRTRRSDEADRVSLMIRHFRRTLGVTPGQFRIAVRGAKKAQFRSIAGSRNL